MNYEITFTHDRVYTIQCDNLVELYIKLQKLMSKHCFYNDEIVSIEHIKGQKWETKLMKLFMY